MQLNTSRYENRFNGKIEKAKTAAIPRPLDLNLNLICIYSKQIDAKIFSAKALRVIGGCYERI
jgi:hypothetical protein